MFAKFFRKVAFVRMNWFARRGRALRLRRRLLGSFFRLEERVVPAAFTPGRTLPGVNAGLTEITGGTPVLQRGNV